MIRDIIGTFLQLRITILPTVGKYGDYDALYEVLSAPQDSHRIVVPYAQSTLTFNAYVTAGQDNLYSQETRRIILDGAFRSVYRNGTAKDVTHGNQYNHIS